MNIEKALEKVTGLTPKQFVEKAIDGGYGWKQFNVGGWGYLLETPFLQAVLLDKNAWIAVGKVEGYVSKSHLIENGYHKGKKLTTNLYDWCCGLCGKEKCKCDGSFPQPIWQYKQYRFIDTLNKE